MEINENLRQVHKKLADKIQEDANVIGIDIGLRLIDENGRIFVDQEESQTWVRVFEFHDNARRRPKIILKEEQMNEVPIQIIQMEGKVSATTSKVTRMARKKYSGSLVGGIPVNGSNRNSNSAYGTLGAIVYDREDEMYKNPFILSCHHVLRDLNEPGKVSGPPVFHPPYSVLNNDSDEEKEFWIGDLIRSGINNNLDCAVAALKRNVEVENKILKLGTVRGSRTPRLGRVIRKSGAVTGVTWGQIDGVYGIWKVGSKESEIRSNLIHISPLGRLDGKLPEISFRGDSGSLWLTEVNDAVALHVAGEIDIPLEYALAHPINDVLETLKIKFNL